MADYYPLIARAVAGLDRNTGENRRALYERARSALVNQLRGVDPPLDESDITRERLALEDAIRRLEADATRRAQPDMTQGVEPEESRPTLRDQGLRDFRDTVTEAQGLGGASAEASRVARAAYDDVHGVDAPSDHAQADAHDDAHDHPYDRSQAQDSEREVESHYFEPPADEGIDAGPHDDRPHEYESVPASHHEAGEHDGAPDMPTELPEPAAKTGWRPPRAAAAHAAEEEDDYSRPVRSYGGIVRIVVLLVAMGSLAWEAMHRLQTSSPIDATTVMLVAGVGVIINTVTAWLFLKGSKGDLNIRGAFLHMAADALVSVGVVLAGGLYLWQGWTWIDPVVSILIALVVVLGTWSLFRRSLHLLFDGVPDGIDVTAVRQSLLNLAGVATVHDLHVWAMSTADNALTAHLVVDSDAVDRDALLEQAVDMLHEQFELRHASLQIESRSMATRCPLNEAC